METEPAITRQQQTDHDVLIELRTEMRAMRVDMKDIRDNFSSRVSLLEHTSFTSDEKTLLLKDVENLKTKIWFAMGGLAIISAMVIPLVIYVFNTKTQIGEQVKVGIVSALQEYEVEVK